MGESRTELIAWLNDLLGLGYTKVEQCGTGAAYAQIIDSIYGNVPMSKLNWAAKADYEYLSNYKVLQEVFRRNKIAKPIPVERLTKCKMQDNLEWLQWSKKFWDANYPGGEYDAEGRRVGAVPTVASHDHPAASQVRLAPGRVSAAAARTRSTASPASPAARRVTRPAGDAAAMRAARQQHEQDAAALAELTAEVDDMRNNVAVIEKERDFYYSKLRDIEILVSDRLELVGEGGQEQDSASQTEVELLTQLQNIMYATDEGFTVPEDVDQVPVDEEEMF